MKPFWEVLNSFPFGALKLKDSVHFFKRGVKPVWEDRRNVHGGAWTIRVPKAKAEEFFKQCLFMGVGEQFADVIQAGELEAFFLLFLCFMGSRLSVAIRSSCCLEHAGATRERPVALSTCLSGYRDTVYVLRNHKRRDYT